MNQEQIKMGMKISKKIAKKNNKNNKHGTLKENQELLNKFGVPENSKFRNDMLGILAANSDKMFMRKFNKWYSSSREIYNNSSDYMVNFFMYCLERFRSINPDYHYNIKSRKIILDEPSEESTEKILDAVPKNPTEAEKKEISELKDQVGKLNKIKETADDIEDKKSKNENTLKELSDKLEESQDEQREELNKKLNEKKAKKNAFGKLIDFGKGAAKVVKKAASPAFKVIDSLATALVEPIQIPKKEENKKAEENKKVEPKTKLNIEPDKILTEEDLNKIVEEFEEEKRNPSNEKIIETFENYPNSSYKTVNMKKDEFLSYLEIVVNDGRFINVKEDIKDKLYKSTGQKALIEDISLNVFNDEFKNRVKFIDDDFGFFRYKFETYMENNLPGFKIGDYVSDTDKLAYDLKRLIKSIDFEWNYKTTDKLNEILDKYGFKIKSITPRTGNTIVFYDFNEQYEKDRKDREDGKIDNNPANSKEFFSYDIHEIYRIIEKGLEIKLSTEAKNDIESIVRMETSNLINHLNISHGSSDIQNVIEKIEKYISSRMKDKSKSFKFTESNRYRLKELLKRFLNTRNNGQK